MGRRPPGRWVDGRRRRTPRPAPLPSPCRCRYISLSPPSEESSNYSVGPNGQAGGRAGRGRSRPARRLAPTNDRPHPPRIIFPLLPFLPFSICSCRRSFPRLAIAERTRTTNSVVGISKPQRASVVLVVDCTERERERRRSVGHIDAVAVALLPPAVDGGVERRFPPFIALAHSSAPFHAAAALAEEPAGRAAARQQPRHGLLERGRRGPLLVESWAELRIGNSLADGGSERARPSAGRPAGRRPLPSHWTRPAGGPRLRERARPAVLDGHDADALSLSPPIYRVLQRSTRASEADADAKLECCPHPRQPASCQCGPNGC